jgi:hypothetical protein
MHKERNVGRPSAVNQFAASIGKMLDEEPEFKVVEVLHRLRLAGYRGGSRSWRGRSSTRSGSSFAGWIQWAAGKS